MFLPPKLTAIVLNSLAILLLIAGSTDAQQAEFSRRVAAMQEARARAQAPPARVADAGVDYSAPPRPLEGARVASATRQSRQAVQSRGVTQASASSNRVANRYAPQHTRTAQLMESSVIDGGSPIVRSGATSVYGGRVDGGIVEGDCSSCGSCGDTGGYFEGCDECCDRGGCPPGPCWLSGLGLAFYNAEYFGGATSFRSTLFTTPGTTAGQLENDCSYGFYGGFNLGIPLCRLTCGVFSGQVGLRSVQTNFDGNEFSAENRDQLFITTGFYRRVDYGLQVGVVADILHEEWFTETDLVQIRGDLGWVYPNGSTLGFRFANNVQDDVNAGTFAGRTFNNLNQSTEDTYQFYFRRESPSGGHGEGFLGWSGGGQTILGLDFDLPIADRLAMQSGFTYYLGDEGPLPASGFAGGNVDEAFNIFVGLAFRPRGRSYFRSYDRPLFNVADNGSMLITRPRP